MKIWLTLCFSRAVIRRATLTALIVGSVLTLINHGGAILRGEVDTIRLLQICLTAIVPYIVSTVSSVSTLIGIESNIQLSENNHQNLIAQRKSHQ